MQFLIPLPKDRRLRLAALMLAAVVAAWILAIAPGLFVPAAVKPAVPAAVPAVMADFNRLTDFVGAALGLLLSGLLAGLVMFSLALFPKIARPAPRRDGNRPWQGPDIALAAALFLFVQTALAAVAGWMRLFGLTPGSFAGFFELAVSLLAQMAAAVYLLTAAYKSTGRGPAALLGIRFRTREIILAPMLYWPGLPLMTMLALAAAALLAVFGLTPQAHPLAQMIMAREQSAGGMAAALVFAACIAPLCEEIFFRGAFFGLLRGKTGFLPAAALSAAVFSLCHLNAVQFLPVFGLGLMLAYAYEATGNIMVPVILHAINNFVSLAAVFALSGIYQGAI